MNAAVIRRTTPTVAPRGVSAAKLRTLDLRAAELLVAPLDVVRLWVLRALGPIARVAVRDRALRVALMGSAIVVVSLIVAATLPMWSLAVAPVVVGVPHLIGDARYLVFRPGLHRRSLVVIALAIPIGAAIGGGGVYAALGGAAAMACVARGSHVRRVVILALVAALTALAWWVGPIASFVFAHVHHLVALVMLFAWRPERGVLHWIPLVLFAIGSAALLLGAADPLLAWTGGVEHVPAEDLGVGHHLASLAPGVAGPLGIRLVLAFAFAQSVHYAVWTRLLPEQDRERETPRTFAESYRALRADLGAPLCLICVAAVIVIAVWACADLAAARTNYLRLSTFHSHVELALAAFFLIEGRPIDASSGRAA